VDYILLSVGILLAVVAICAFPWLCQWFIRGLIHSWRNAPAGGSAFNPLQELVQLQIRHVVEVQQHRLKEDDSGSPPAPES
jgi:hypothetical protein